MINPPPPTNEVINLGEERVITRDISEAFDARDIIGGAAVASGVMGGAAAYALRNPMESAQTALDAYDGARLAHLGAGAARAARTQIASHAHAAYTEGTVFGAVEHAIDGTVLAARDAVLSTHRTPEAWLADQPGSSRLARYRAGGLRSLVNLQSELDRGTFSTQGNYTYANVEPRNIVIEGIDLHGFSGASRVGEMVGINDAVNTLRAANTIHHYAVRPAVESFANSANTFLDRLGLEPGNAARDFVQSFYDPYFRPSYSGYYQEVRLDEMLRDAGGDAGAAARDFLGVDEWPPRSWSAANQTLNETATSVRDGVRGAVREVASAIQGETEVNMPRVEGLFEENPYRGPTTQSLFGETNPFNFYEPPPPPIPEPSVPTPSSAPLIAEETVARVWPAPLIAEEVPPPEVGGSIGNVMRTAIMAQGPPEVGGRASRFFNPNVDAELEMAANRLQAESVQTSTNRLVNVVDEAALSWHPLEQSSRPAEFSPAYQEWVSTNPYSELEAATASRTSALARGARGAGRVLGRAARFAGPLTAFVPGSIAAITAQDRYSHGEINRTQRDTAEFGAVGGTVASVAGLGVMGATWTAVEGALLVAPIPGTRVVAAVGALVASTGVGAAIYQAGEQIGRAVYVVGDAVARSPVGEAIGNAVSTIGNAITNSPPAIELDHAFEAASRAIAPGIDFTGERTFNDRYRLPPIENAAMDSRPTGMVPDPFNTSNAINHRQVSAPHMHGETYPRLTGNQAEDMQFLWDDLDVAAQRAERARDEGNIEEFNRWRIATSRIATDPHFNEVSRRQYEMLQARHPWLAMTQHQLQMRDTEKRDEEMQRANQAKVHDANVRALHDQKMDQVAADQEYQDAKHREQQRRNHIRRQIDRASHTDKFRLEPAVVHPMTHEPTLGHVPNDPHIPSTVNWELVAHVQELLDANEGRNARVY